MKKKGFFFNAFDVLSSLPLMNASIKVMVFSFNQVSSISSHIQEGFSL
jgi:hypothetical protein